MKISLLPLAEEISPDSLRALSLSEGREHYFNHRHIAEHPKIMHPLCKAGATNAAPQAVVNCGQLRDASPGFLPLYLLSSKFSSESGFETGDPEVLEALCPCGPMARRGGAGAAR